MGKLTVTGFAKKEYEYDEVTLYITFHSEQSSLKSAMQKLNKQVESFLSSLKAKGLDLKEVKLNDDNINERRYDGNHIVEVQRGLSVTVLNDVDTINGMISLLAAGDYNVNYHQEYELSVNPERDKELLAEAVKDSRAKAEVLAQSVNSKIVGVDTIGYHNYPYNQPIMLRGKFAETDECAGLINEVSSKTTMLEKEIEVVWIIE